MDSDEPQHRAVGEPAGQQLKRAREKHGLSLKDIADAQHLRVSIIQAIEDGDYDQIDTELFLKGYVRAYAKQVGADADALIQSLDLELEPLRREKDQQEQENPLVDIERRRRKKRQVAKVLGIIVLLGAIALAGWKLVLEPRMAADLTGGQDQSESVDASENPDSSASEGTEPGNQIGEAPQPDQSPAEVTPEEGSEVSASPEVENGSEVVGNSGLPEESLSGDSAQSLGNSGTAETPVVAEVSGLSQAPVTENTVDSSELAGVDPVVQPAPVFEESVQPQSVSVLTQLEMSFVSDCWVQVTDSSGARLVAALQRDGDQVSVSGRPPLKVVIGAVDAVDTVSFSGDPVNLSSFRVVNNRTEFTLTL